MDTSSRSHDLQFRNPKVHVIVFGLVAMTLMFGVSCVLTPTPVVDEGLMTTLESLSTQNAKQATDLARHEELISYLATNQPGRVVSQSDVPTSTPYKPVIGSIEIEDGRCCAGGVAGQTMDLNVKFEAQSLAGEPITEMRVRLGGIAMAEEDLVEEPWISFRTEDILIIEPSINWTTYVLSVQYRDRAGNVSEVYSDEIAIEGAPPETPIP